VLDTKSSLVQEEAIYRPNPKLHVTKMKIKGRTFSYVVKKAEGGGYTAKCVELPQVHTEGETLKEVDQNMHEALSLAIDYLLERAHRERGKIVEITIR
jgi:predicted RNase H-like HicB family nuclease